MLTGVDFRQAIKYWTQGREVIVIDRSSLHASGGYDNFPFEDLFKNVELLADVPVVEYPEFRQEVEDMIQKSGSENTERFLELRIAGRALGEGVKDAIEKAEEDTETPPPLTGPEKKAPPAGKPKKELALELAAKGMPVKEIADQIGVKYGTVYYWVKNDSNKKPGWNADRHACQTCMYRATGPLKTNGAGCDYVSIAGRSRECTVADCEKYIKGTPKSKKKQVKG